MLEAQCARYSDTISSLKEQIRDYTATGNSYKDRLAKLQKEVDNPLQFTIGH